MEGVVLKNYLSITVVALALAACGQQASVEPAVSGPTETADEFVARANAELEDIRRELGAAGWVRATYITQDTALLQSRARERYSAWHSDMVKQAMQ